MAALAFDALKFARRLIAAGVPEKQAETQAELMAEAFVYNMDAVVTKDYLDARFSEQDARLETRLIEQDTRTNSRFASMDQKLASIDKTLADMDQRFAGIDPQFAGIDQKFSEIDKKFAGIDVHFAEIKGRFMVQDWILGAIAACTVLPTLYSLFNP